MIVGVGGGGGGVNVVLPLSATDPGRYDDWLELMLTIWFPVRPAGYEAVKVHDSWLAGNPENAQSSTWSPDEGDTRAAAPPGSDCPVNDHPDGSATSKLIADGNTATAFALAPLPPPPENATLGLAVYPLPPPVTVTAVTAPLLTVAVAVAPLPPPPDRVTVGALA